MSSSLVRSPRREEDCGDEEPSSISCGIPSTEEARLTVGRGSQGTDDTVTSVRVIGQSGSSFLSLELLATISSAKSRAACARTQYSPGGI